VTMLKRETEEERMQRFERAFGVTRADLRGMRCYLTYDSGVKLGLDSRVLRSWRARHWMRDLEAAELLRLLEPYPGEEMKDPSEVVEHLSCATASGGYLDRSCNNCPFDLGKTEPCALCVPTVEWLDSLVRVLAGRRVVEVCAGTGVIAGLMRRRGVDWTATDWEPRGENVRKLDALEAVKNLNPEVIFASWIPYRSRLDVRLAETGLPLILVGENYGCTGSEEFWAKYEPVPLTELYSDFEDVPNWDGIHDFTSALNWEALR